MDVAPDEIGYPAEKEDKQDTFSGVVRMHKGFDDYLPEPPSCQLLKPAITLIDPNSSILRESQSGESSSRHAAFLRLGSI